MIEEAQAAAQAGETQEATGGGAPINVDSMGDLAAAGFRTVNIPS